MNSVRLRTRPTWKRTVSLPPQEPGQQPTPLLLCSPLAGMRKSGLHLLLGGRPLSDTRLANTGPKVQSVALRKWWVRAVFLSDCWTHISGVVLRKTALRKSSVSSKARSRLVPSKIGREVLSSSMRRNTSSPSSTFSFTRFSLKAFTPKMVRHDSSLSASS